MPKSTTEVTSCFLSAASTSGSHIENLVLASGDPSGLMGAGSDARSSSEMVEPRAFGFCSVAMTGISSIRAALTWDSYLRIEKLAVDIRYLVAYHLCRGVADFFESMDCASYE